MYRVSRAIVDMLFWWLSRAAPTCHGGARLWRLAADYIGGAFTCHRRRLRLHGPLVVAAHTCTPLLEHGQGVSVHTTAEGFHGLRGYQRVTLMHMYATNKQWYLSLESKFNLVKIIVHVEVPRVLVILRIKSSIV